MNQSSTIATNGDIVTVACGVYATKPRPAQISQDDRFDATDSLTVCPFTSTEIDAALLRVSVTADQDNGLDHDNFLMVDKMTAVQRSNAGTVVGKFEATTSVEFERRLLASQWRIFSRLVSSDTIRSMAMTLRLTDADDRLLTERARSQGRSKQELAREAIHAYLTDQVRRLEDLEDELALARYQLRQQLGEVTYVSQAEARSALGLPPSPPRRASV